MSRHESEHSGGTVHETLSPSVCLGGMEERENKEIILCWCLPYYWHKSGASGAISTVCGYVGDRDVNAALLTTGRKFRQGRFPGRGGCSKIS